MYSNEYFWLFTFYKLVLLFFPFQNFKEVQILGRLSILIGWNNKYQVLDKSIYTIDKKREN